MRGAARAIGWEFQRHHRLGLAVLVAYLVAFWVLKTWLLGPDTRIRLDPPNGLAGLVIAPLTITYFFFVGVFSYGLAGDLGAREAAFPSRMFTLPVRSVALALWPMAYGTLASTGLWIVAMALARVSGGLDIALPWVWPALMMAVFLAWMQALTWLAYPLRGLRVVVAVILLTSVDAIVLLAIHFHASEATMIAILAPQLLLAYVVGCFAVARARCGEVPDWSRFFARVGGGRAARGTFASSAAAQAWLEWRRHGRTLPVLVAFVVPCELLLLFIQGIDRAPVVFANLFLVFLTPPALALLAAPALATFTAHAATRPLTSASLVAAKLRMTVMSTLAAWLLVAAFVIPALLLSGAMIVVVETMREFAEVSGVVRATLVSVLLVAAVVSSTWKNLVLSLCIGLSGRPWVIRGSVLAALVLLTAAFPLVWVVVWKDGVQAFVWDYLPWIMAALVWMKLGAGAWVAMRLHDSRVIGDRMIVGGLLAWLAAAVMIYAVLRWIAASPIFPPYLLGSIAILSVPLARLAGAPLALAWSRHR